MNYTVTLLALALCCQSALADPVADRFAAGVLGMQWNASLEWVVAVRPEGEHFYATSKGERGYTVEDDQEFMGVARRGQRIRYWFDENDKVESISLSFPYERKEELLGSLVSAFGYQGYKVTHGRTQLIAWRGHNGIVVLWMATIDPSHGIAWLQIDRPE